MKFVPSMFRVIFQEYRDRSVEFTVTCTYISDQPIDGVYQRHTLTLLYPVSYSRYDNNYSRIVNLCTPSRMGGVSLSEDAIKYDSYFSKNKELFRYDYGFHYAEEMARFAKALEFYGICYDYDALMDD